jgi:hypothetical protein
VQAVQPLQVKAGQHALGIMSRGLSVLRVRDVSSHLHQTLHEFHATGTLVDACIDYLHVSIRGSM